MFRHSPVPRGGAWPATPNAARWSRPRSTPARPDYQAFQFVLWAGSRAARGAGLRRFRDQGLGLTGRGLPPPGLLADGLALAAIACKSRAPISPRAARSSPAVRPEFYDHLGCSQTQNLALAPRHAPLRRRPQGADLRRGRGLGRTAPPAPHRPEERHVSRPTGPEAEVDDQRSLSLRATASQPTIRRSRGDRGATLAASHTSSTSCHLRARSRSLKSFHHRAMVGLGGQEDKASS